TAVRLVSEEGFRSVTMSQIAEEAGIGRATLYKYFPDVESILRAWHEQQIESHLAELTEPMDVARTPEEKLEALLSAYATRLSRASKHRDSDLAALLHKDEHVVKAQRRVARLFKERIAEAAEAGLVRDDLTSEELANYCIHALAGAGEVRT